MARPKDKSSRRSKAERKRLEKLLAERVHPTDRILTRRRQFAFVQLPPEQRQDGRNGEIDSEVCDGIGQLHALGLLDGNGHEARDLRDIGRQYAELYWERYEATGPATGQFERRSRGTGDPPPRNGRDNRFDKLDSAMPRIGMERTAIHMLVIHHYHSDNLEGWVQRLVNYELAKRGVPDVLVDTHSHGHDCYMLGCAIRGLVQLMDAGLPARFERRAA